MIVAVASEQPLFLSDQSDKAEAPSYLRKLEQRLEEIKALTSNNRIAASQLLINVE